MKNLLIEKNLPYIPNKIVEKIFKFFKERFYIDSYKYSIAIQRQYNRDNNLPLDFSIDKIKNEFKKLGVNKIHNDYSKIVEFSSYDFPPNYQKRLSQISNAWKLNISIYRHGISEAYFSRDDNMIGIKNNMITRIFYEDDSKMKKSFTSMSIKYNTFSMFYTNESEYFKKIVSNIRHELVHYIESILKNPSIEQLKNKKKFYAPDIKNNFTKLGEINYYDSNVELKSQIMTTYSSISSYFRGSLNRGLGLKIDALSGYELLYNFMANTYNIFAGIALFPIYIVANNEKRTLQRLKILLNLLYKNKKLIYDKKLEKKYLKKYLSALKKRYKNYRKSKNK